MMRLSNIVATCVVVAALPSWVVSAESPLAAAARKEQERRKQVKATSSVLTNDNLRGSSAPASEPAESASAEAQPAGSGEKAEGKTPSPAADAAAAQEKEAQRAALQTEIDGHVERIRDLRRQIADIDRELADRLTSVEGPRRAQLAQRREEGTQLVAESETRIAELQDKARKLGVSVTRPE